MYIQPIVSSVGENSIIKHAEKLHSKLNVSCAVTSRYILDLFGQENVSMPGHDGQGQGGGY